VTKAARPTGTTIRYMITRAKALAVMIAVMGSVTFGGVAAARRRPPYGARRSS
jgi:hypothetical protein